MKTCCRCRTTKPYSDFSKSKNRFDGYQYLCKACDSVRQKSPARKAARKAYRVSERGQAIKRASNLRLYGLTPEKYDEILEGQNGACAICKTSSEACGRKLAVDHCHVSGVVRGILCSQCNQAVGKFRDSTTNLEAAIRYLRNSEGSL